MCIIGLKAADDFQWLIDEFEGLLVDLQVASTDYAHGFYCGMRSHLGFYDTEGAKELLSESQRGLHLDLWRTYVNTVDLFPSMTTDEVIEATKMIIEILGRLSPVIEDEDEHECDEYESECYFSEYLEQRERANRAERQIDAYKEEMYLLRKREAALIKELSYMKRQRISNIRHQQTRKRKNRR